MCSAPGMELFYSLDGIPTNSCILLSTHQEAIDYPQGNMRLAGCLTCGFISNLAFDSGMTEYSGRYEETQGFSGTFNTFHIGLADELIDRHDLRNREVIEIGCGKGEFLWLLADRGGNRCLGFDPSFQEDRLPDPGQGSVRVERKFFEDHQAEVQADFICCKMTLEHISQPRPLIAALKRTVERRPGGVVFFQVPDTTRILADCAFEDIYYEHCSYFSAGSIVRLFEEVGFSVASVETVYGGQYLTVEAVLRSESGQGAKLDTLAPHKELVASFQSRAELKVAEWQDRLDRLAQQERRVAVWGSGSKAVAFLSAVSRDDAVDDVVDINPLRRGHFMPRSGHRIVGPGDLAHTVPDTVIVMNPIYRDEVVAELHGLEISPQVLTL